MPPIGRSLWRKVVPGGVKAKTIYPPRPDNWGNEDWPSNQIFALIQAGLLNAKSIGFIPTKTHTPGAIECQQNNWPEGALVIDKWILSGVRRGHDPRQPGNRSRDRQQDARQIGRADPKKSLWVETSKKTTPPTPEVIPFTTYFEFNLAVERRLKEMSIEKMAQNSIARAMGGGLGSPGKLLPELVLCVLSAFSAPLR